jgi:hypothetical protein
MVYQPSTTVLIAISRHMPGKHDQKDHGRRGLKSEKVIKETYEFEDAETGFSTKVSRIDTPFGDTKEVEIDISNRDGRSVGYAKVFISANGKEVHHSEVVMNARVRGQGFATRQRVRIFEAYQRHGVKKITQTAGLDVGGYAWARAGFRFSNAANRRAIADHVSSHAHRYNKGVQDEIRRIAKNPKSEPIDFAMIGHTAGAKMWPGKQMMLGSSWEGVIRL